MTGDTRAVAARWSDGPAQRLDGLLKAAGLRDVDLARAMKLDASTINRYRSGERVPNADVLADMVERAAGSADEVLGLKPPVLDPQQLRDVVEASHAIVAALPRLPRGRADRPPRGK